MNPPDLQSKVAERNWLESAAQIENNHLQQFLFLIILLMLIASGTQGLNLIENPGDPTTLRLLVYASLSVMGCVLAYVLTLQPRTREAAIVAVLSICAPVVLHAWSSGFGIRAPVIYLLTPPILIAYYILGLRFSVLLTIACCCAAIVLYVAEGAGWIAGYDSASLPLSANNLISLWLIVTCGLAAANAIRERKELTLAVARERKNLLERTISDIELAENSQRQFMESVSGAVAANAAQLHQLTGINHTIPGQGNEEPGHALDTRSIHDASQRMMQALDAAVEKTERETRFFLEDGSTGTATQAHFPPSSEDPPSLSSPAGGTA